MKKIFIAFLSILLLSTSAFAKKWTNNIGAGVSVPFSIIGVDKKGEDDIKQIGYGADGIYIGVHDNGLTAKANLSFGVITSKDITIQNKKTNIGSFENLELGAGYSFVHTEKVLFGATVMGGVEFGQYSLKEENIAKPDDEEIECDKTTSLLVITTSIGADIFAMYRFTPKFGFFGNVSARWILYGIADREELFEWEEKKRTKSEKISNDTDLLGKVIIQPTIGVIWTF